ncbi:hypothetical protein I6A62_32190 [Frankia sp. AgW1.1]|nr:hypothetical protein [Frankia sp. AgW1.1]MBL7492658.1 hypothetical protein [Frankia sp. AgW1.1]
MFDLLGARSRTHVRVVREGRLVPYQRIPARIDTDSRPPEAPAPATLPPSVARLAARTRLSAELLAAIIAVDGRTRATLDDMARADALADVLLARRRQRAGRQRPEPAGGAATADGITAAHA